MEGCPSLERGCGTPTSKEAYPGPWIKQVAGGQLQAFLDETNYLDPVHPDFRPNYRAETALLALAGDE